MNEFQRILLHYKDLSFKYNDDWSWEAISRNPNITMDFILKNREFPWKFEYISENPNLNMEMIKMFPKENFNFNAISLNSNISFVDIIKNNEFPWNWDNISRNPNITESIIISNLDKPWNWDILMSNINISQEFIINNLNKTSNNKTTWKYISSNPNIKEDFIEKYINNISFYELSMYNNNMSLEFVIKHKKHFVKHDCVIHFVSCNFNNIKEIFEKYLNDFPWNFEALIITCNITEELIDKYFSKIQFLKVKDKHLNDEFLWEYICHNDSLTEELIEKYYNKGKPIDWEIISNNPNISIDFILKHIDKSWNWCAISEQNNNITLENLNINLIEFSSLSINDFNYYKINKILGKVDKFGISV